MHQALDQEDVLSANVGFVAEENLHGIVRRAAGRPGVAWLDELANYRDFQRAHQVGLKHERVFEHRQYLDGVASIVIGDLPRQFLDSFLDLISGDNRAKGLDSRTHLINSIHEVACLPVSADLYAGNFYGSNLAAKNSSTIKMTVRAGLAPNFAGVGKPRIQTISSPLTTTGQNLRSGCAT